MVGRGHASFQEAQKYDLVADFKIWMFIPIHWFLAFGGVSP